jgi:hypothetical protein
MTAQPDEGRGKDTTDSGRRILLDGKKKSYR